MPKRILHTFCCLLILVLVMNEVSSTLYYEIIMEFSLNEEEEKKSSEEEIDLFQFYEVSEVLYESKRRSFLMTNQSRVYNKIFIDIITPPPEFSI